MAVGIRIYRHIREIDQRELSFVMDQLDQEELAVPFQHDNNGKNPGV